MSDNMIQNEMQDRFIKDDKEIYDYYYEFINERNWTEHQALNFKISLLLSFMKTHEYPPSKIEYILDVMKKHSQESK